ncbi:MAG: hypothetical protein U1E76_06500 [Planctomycetota bacterium]
MSSRGSSRTALFLGAAALLLLLQLCARWYAAAERMPITDAEQVELGRAYALLHRDAVPAAARAGPPASAWLSWAPVLARFGPHPTEELAAAQGSPLALGRRVIALLADPSHLLMAARALSLVMFLALTILLSRTTSVRTGAESALIAICWITLDQNLIDRFTLAAPHALLALTLALALLAFSRYLARRSLLWCALGRDAARARGGTSRSGSRFRASPRSCSWRWRAPSCPTAWTCPCRSPCACGSA